MEGYQGQGRRITVFQGVLITLHFVQEPRTYHSEGQLKFLKHMSVAECTAHLGGTVSHEVICSVI